MTDKVDIGVGNKFAHLGTEPVMVVAVMPAVTTSTVYSTQTQTVSIRHTIFEVVQE